MEKQLLLFGLMKKAGRLCVGDEPVTDALTFGSARVMALASDAAENTVRRFERLAEEVEVPVVHLRATKKELGESLGRASAAVIAVSDIGFAARFLELACEEEPENEELAAARDRMTKKAERLVEEQKKKRKEEKEAKKHPNKAKTTQPATEKVQERTKQETAARKTDHKSSDGKKNDSGVRTYVPAHPPKKVYGKAPGRQKSQTSIGDRRREDAEKKAEKYGYSAGNSSKKSYGGSKNYSKQGSYDRQRKSGKPGTKATVHGKGGKA